MKQLDMQFPIVSGAGSLSDEVTTISYGDIAGLPDSPVALFAPYPRENMYCIALITTNSVTHVALMLYLLSARINFLLIGNQPSLEQRIPTFCDFILTTDPAGSARLDPNPRYSQGPFDIGLNTGAVFLMSSGTTGPAKYVYFNRDNLIRNAENCIERFSLRPQSRVLVPVPVHHMYGLGVGLLPALLSGASIRLINKNNIVKLLDGIAGFMPDVTLLTPAVIKMLLTLRHQFKGRGIYITAGEKLDGKVHRRFGERYGPLYNLYGCTELGAIAVSDHENCTLLKPLKDVEIRIDPAQHDQILCRHNSGFECYVDGRGHRIPVGGQEWYPTRDIGTDAGNGRFTLTGRIDNCINRHGFLVSLDEVGSFLEEVFEEINQAVVFEGRDEGLAARLIAVCELVSGCTLDPVMAKKICRDKRQSHLVPDQFFFLDEIPRLGNGKPDKALLLSRFQ